MNKLSQTEIDEVIADSEKWAEYDLVSTAVSTDKYFKFENIDSTQTYYVTELKQPAGYNKNTDIRKVTVEVNGKVYFLKDADTCLLYTSSNGTIINAVDGNADANITFNSRIVEKVNGQDVDVSQADSGDSFFLAIYYAVSASTDASKYTECTLSITLPNDIEFDETTDISNTGFDSIEQRTSLGKNILSIKSKELAAGQSGTLYLKMHFKNMTTKIGRAHV